MAVICSSYVNGMVMIKVRTGMRKKAQTWLNSTDLLIKAFL